MRAIQKVCNAWIRAMAAWSARHVPPHSQIGSAMLAWAFPLTWYVPRLRANGQHPSGASTQALATAPPVEPSVPPPRRARCALGSSPAVRGRHKRRRKRIGRGKRCNSADG